MIRCSSQVEKKNLSQNEDVGILRNKKTIEDLIRGVFEQNIANVYDPLIAGQNASFVISANKLTQLGISLPWQNFHEAPLLHITMSGGTEAFYHISKMLISAGAKPSDFSCNYGPAVLYELGMGKEDLTEDMATTIQYLLKEDKLIPHFDIGIQIKDWNSLKGFSHNPPVLNFAAASNFVLGAFALVNEGFANVNDADRDGCSPIHITSYRAAQNFVSFLITHGAERMPKDKNDRTPLHYAALRGHTKVIETLLQDLKKFQIKSYLKMQDAFGFTAKDLSCRPPKHIHACDFFTTLYNTHDIKTNDATSPDDVSIDPDGEYEVYESEDGNSSPDFQISSTVFKEPYILPQRSPHDILSVSSSFASETDWHCSALPTNIETSFDDEIDLVDGSIIKRDQFIRNYISTQRPALIVGNITSNSNVWKYLNKKSFIDIYGGISISTGVIPYADRFNRSESFKKGVKIADWVQEISKKAFKPTCGDKGSRCNGNAKFGGEGFWIANHNLRNKPTTMAEKLLSDLKVPDLFSICHNTESKGDDIIGDDTDDLVIQSTTDWNSTFSLSNNVELVIGAYSSGTPAHSHEGKWNVLLTGRKHWLLVPPSALGFKKRYISEKGQALTHWEYVNSMRENKQAFHVTQLPGDVLYIPSGWIHMTLHACESVALSSSICSENFSASKEYDPSGKDHINFPPALASVLYGG